MLFSKPSGLWLYVRHHFIIDIRPCKSNDSSIILLIVFFKLHFGKLKSNRLTSMKLQHHWML